MKKSNYFTELYRSYLIELEDLAENTEGTSVLKKHLDEKRSAIDLSLEMAGSNPEMEAGIFYGAFSFSRPQAFQALVATEPEEVGLPGWENIGKTVVIEGWAQPMVSKALDHPNGNDFLVISAALEFLRTNDPNGLQEPDQESSADEEDDEDADDLGDRGDEWLQQQGFDSRES